MRREYLPLESLPAWAKLNGISLDGVTFRHLKSEDGGSDKGAAVVSTKEETNAGSNSNNDTSSTKVARAQDEEPNDWTKILIRIPLDAILSLEGVNNYAKSDRYLREVLEAVGDFGRTARGAILIFLLIQITYCSPDFAEERQKVGVSNPWTEYMKFLPSSIPLPTFYSEEERELLRGTSLRMAVDAKILALEREFDHLRQCTEERIPWCRRYWWDEGTGKLTLDDWKYVDAVYRSRMVDFPGNGNSMVPCVDMANHASGVEANSLYEVDREGNVVLELRWGKHLGVGEEVTISYGDEKSAAEMVFSYGFLEEGISSARQIFLDLDIPDDDPLKFPKQVFCKNNTAPGVRLFVDPSESEHTKWDSGFIWWVCVNEDDGLDFEILQTTDGEKELRATWKEGGDDTIAMGRSEDLRERLSADPLWDVFQLRAVVILLGRFEAQLSTLEQTQDVISDVCRDENLANAIFGPGIFGTVSKLRELEADLLRRGIDDLKKEKDKLLTSEAVNSYLGQRQQLQSEDVEEDFS